MCKGNARKMLIWKTHMQWNWTVRRVALAGWNTASQLWAHCNAMAWADPSICRGCCCYRCYRGKCMVCDLFAAAVSMKASTNTPGAHFHPDETIENWYTAFFSFSNCCFNFYYCCVTAQHSALCCTHSHSRTHTHTSFIMHYWVFISGYWSTLLLLYNYLIIVPIVISNTSVQFFGRWKFLWFDTITSVSVDLPIMCGHKHNRNKRTYFMHCTNMVLFCLFV